MENSEYLKQVLNSQINTNACSRQVGTMLVVLNFNFIETIIEAHDRKRLTTYDFETICMVASFERLTK